MGDRMVLRILLAFVLCLPCLVGGSSHSRVLVLGAGASGVSFARELFRNGWKNFTILEGKDYIGGRIRKTTLDSTTIEIGANWIQRINADNLMWKLKKEFGLNTSTDVYSNITVRDENGTVDASASHEYKHFSKQLHNLTELAYTAGEENHPDIPMSSSINRYGVSIDTPVKKALEYFFVDFEYATTSGDISAKQTEFSGTDDGDNFVIDPRGYNSIIAKLAENFTSQIKLSTFVNKIHRSSNGVEVETKNGMKYTADYLVVTFSTGVLRRRNLFVPDLPQWKYDALSMLPMGHYTKIFLKFPAKFWEDTNYVLLSPYQQGYYSVWMNLKKPEFHPSENIYLVTVTGKESIRVEGLTDAQVQAEIMVVLRNTYGAGVPDPTSFKMSRWSRDPETYGAYIAPAVGTDSLVFKHMNQPLDENVVWFTGEACSESMFGYTHGALDNGKTQAASFLSCVDGKKTCPVLSMRKAACQPTSSAAGNNRGYSIMVTVVSLIAVLIASFE